MTHGLTNIKFKICTSEHELKSQRGLW